ncbi:MAG: NB-ARC domain-containing protein [Anaerolineales bacterium]
MRYSLTLECDHGRYCRKTAYMTLDRKTLRKTLRNWDQSKVLGESPLARLRLVDSRRTASGYGETQVGFGIALREVLQELIEALKPENGPSDPLEKIWRPHRILAGLYIQGRSPDFLANEMGIARNTFNHEQAAALDQLLASLSEREEREQSETFPAPRVAVPLTVPPRSTHGLIGRESLLDEMKTRLMRSQRLALQGLPGVGKTALAIELGHDMRGHFADGVLWTSLGPTPDVAVQFHLWEIAIGLHPSEIRELPDLKSRASQLHSLIGERRILMIIDDVWDEAAARAFEIGGANCSYLFTMRSPKIAASLAGEIAIGVPELDEVNSLALLERFVPRPKQPVVDRWRELVQAVGGLPQALVIAGGALRTAAYADQPRRLRDFLDRLADPAELLSLERTRSALDQQAGLPSDEPISLQAVIALSDKALEPATRSALRSLSIFPAKPSTFDEQAAIAISGETTQELDRLVDAGLLEPSGGERYAMHRTIGDFSRTLMDTSAPVGAMVDHFVRLTERNSGQFNALNPEIQNILAALRLASENGLDEEFINGANALYPYLEANGLLAEADHLLSQAIAASGDRTQTLLNAGRAAQRLGKLDQAEQYFQAAAKAEEDVSAVCAALLGLGATAFERGEHALAEERYLRGLSLAKEERLRQREAALLTNIGILAVSQGDLAQAESHFAEALGHARAVEDRTLLGPILTNLGVIAARNQQFESANEYFEEAVEMARADGNRRMMAFLHTNIGALAHDQADEARAGLEFEAALSLSKEIGDNQRMSHVLASLGALATAQRDFETADSYLGEGLKLAREANLKENEVLLLINSAEVQRELGNGEEERALLLDAQELAEEIGHERYEGIASERLDKSQGLKRIQLN